MTATDAEVLEAQLDELSDEELLEVIEQNTDVEHLFPVPNRRTIRQLRRKYKAAGRSRLHRKVRKQRTGGVK